MHWLRLLKEAESELKPDLTVVLTDSGVAPLLGDLFAHERIVVPEGESSKSFRVLEEVLGELVAKGATRNTLLVNIGGGMVCDLGGLAAGLFMRGIKHINIPTTLLGMADAGIGGKTAIDFRGLKNQIGLFKQPEKVIIDSFWLETLSQELLRDGFAEVVKSALLDSEEYFAEALKQPDILTAASLDNLARRAAEFKRMIVDRDPCEIGIRRILNFGHTAGHAFESLSASEGGEEGSLTHGEAVAHGIDVALTLSARRYPEMSDIAQKYRTKILRRFYRPLPRSSADCDRLLEIMTHDKKNLGDGLINFILLKNVGEPETSALDSREIMDALRIAI